MGNDKLKCFLDQGEFHNKYKLKKTQGILSSEPQSALFSMQTDITKPSDLGNNKSTVETFYEPQEKQYLQRSQHSGKLGPAWINK